MDPTGGGGTSADIVPIQIIFGVDPCTRCWDIAQKPPKCKNSPLTPIVTKISFASFSARRGPPTLKLPRFRLWCLLYPEPKFHADRTILRWDILNRTNKQTNKQTKTNLISRQTLRYGEIIKTALKVLYYWSNEANYWQTWSMMHRAASLWQQSYLLKQVSGTAYVMAYVVSCLVQSIT